MASSHRSMAGVDDSGTAAGPGDAAGAGPDEAGVDDSGIGVGAGINDGADWGEGDGGGDGGGDDLIRELTGRNTGEQQDAEHCSASSSESHSSVTSWSESHSAHSQECAGNIFDGGDDNGGAGIGGDGERKKGSGGCCLVKVNLSNNHATDCGAANKTIQRMAIANAGAARKKQSVA